VSDLPRNEVPARSQREWPAHIDHGLESAAASGESSYGERKSFCLESALPSPQNMVVKFQRKRLVIGDRDFGPSRRQPGKHPTNASALDVLLTGRSLLLSKSSQEG